ncbi:RNA 2'-phosphotransferase [Adhaeribacter pallidiroseus]|uniref:Probable RNA 2'-phosphotransferase n=1 Tax=Adhaeribacter pallidiroseus TaxID=2072847 RepID=A0A369QKK0_9BACT|nr:RNA 2'-phosphotransferase [Adhaeribacter pallidiroseus]RDC64912.1 putative RNA 2'-phosphotransferase [Adhaeribacter pallidiroseus]
MLSEKELVRLSKLLSLVPRHQPEKIGIALDENGWIEITTLIEQANKNNVKLSREILEEVVATNTKKRFAFNADKTKIRASQGHSIAVYLNYTPQTPPAILYHGTSERALKSILENGLQKQNRHHVHLSTDVVTARNVGQRHGRPIILRIDAAAMTQNGYLFYLSENQVWLTDQVPTRYLHVQAS